MQREEEEEALREPTKRLFHLCIVNLVIGTLYCSKNNYDFGIKRIIKSMDPFGRKLGTDTWYYAKRCVLAMAMGMAKHVVTIQDDILEMTIDFLESADVHGKNIPASTGVRNNIYSFNIMIFIMFLACDQ